MNEFRIVQVEPLTHPLPYAVEERRKVWCSFWSRWQFLKEWTDLPWRWRVPLLKFQTPALARLHIDQRMARQAEQQLLQEQKKLEKQQRQQLPRVIEVLRVPQPC
ncbi:hypothetical protein Q5H93_05015 [Hymenobacter sp. ASUV-10]|uniref:Uncharacterized protein n=1 Tax=Hymenobacter aranciens TaxID=3063996 RepID=A0ABT9B738_9BACT|nr:hypothetical protein [Hymenobacter sp. ASUV-10]MDO7874084.1 hypothetical protein [Hymenobacter sp. ASUV-10]